MTWARIRKAMPTGMKQWQTAAMLALAAFVGWIITPALWVAVGPRQWVVYVLATASAESAYGEYTTGASAGEAGVLQFTPVGAGQVGWEIDPDDDWRESTWWSGLAAARYMRNALSQRPWAWALRVPIYGMAVMRRLWRGGPTAARDGAWAEYTAEWRATGAYTGWTVITVGPAALALYLLTRED